MNALFEKKSLEFPVIISLTELPILNQKKLNAVWRAENLPELYLKLKNHTGLNIEILLPEELLSHNKYGLPKEDIELYQMEENLALIRFNDELLIMSLKLYTPPTQILENLLQHVCHRVKLYTLNSCKELIISQNHNCSVVAGN